MIWLFAAAAVLVALFFLLIRWKKGVRKNMGDKKLVDALTSSFSPYKFTLKFILLLIAFVLGILAAINPRRPGTSSSVERKGIDIAIALDVSKSMLAADLAPSRLERAKQFIRKLMDEMPNDRIALILFAGKAYMQMPLTADHGAAQLFVSSAGPDVVPQQGTVISDALRMSARVFNTEEKRYSAVILISDGEDHDNDAAGTASSLSEQGMMINTVGLGSTEGSVIIDPATGSNKTDESGNTVISKLNEELLKKIAGNANGVYIHLQNSDEAVKLLKKQLSQIDSKAYSGLSGMNFSNYFIWLAAGMLLLLLIENFIPETQKVIAA